MTNFIFPEQRQKERYVIIAGSVQADKPEQSEDKNLSRIFRTSATHLTYAFLTECKVNTFINFDSGIDWLKT